MSKASSDFVRLCMNGEVLLEEIDNFVEDWHENPCGVPLHDYLGMTWEEYSLWVADNDILPYIITAHRDRVDINSLLEKYYYALPMAARAENSGKAKLLMKWLKERGKLD